MDCAALDVGDVLNQPALVADVPDTDSRVVGPHDQGRELLDLFVVERAAMRTLVNDPETGSRRNGRHG